MSNNYSRRSFLRTAGTVAAVGALPVTWVELAFAKPEDKFTFAYISDSHIQHIRGYKFVTNWDRGLIRAVAATLRSVGVLNAPSSSSPSVMAKRPSSEVEGFESTALSTSRPFAFASMNFGASSGILS